MEERAREPSIGVAEGLCDGVAVVFLPSPFEFDRDVESLTSRFRNSVLFMFTR